MQGGKLAALACACVVLSACATDQRVAVREIGEVSRTASAPMTNVAVVAIDRDAAARKTWEGAFGGVVAVLAYGLLLSPQLPATLAGNLPLLAVLLSVLAAISILGDLFESLLKRQAGLKDSSNVLPGHGGVLDRIDSLTSTLPLVALVWLATQP